MEFVERLKTLRKQARLTQAQVAEKLNISQQGYGDWERGVKKPTQENLIKIAKFYGVTTDYLLEGQKDDIDLSNVEVLFRMTSDGLTEEEKVIFRDELIEFMKERKKLFDEDKK
ncbi:helix-turn-helix domain-containing protein [Streptococcus agalactiae]|uniref:helix-turn-helix domain-containing protein n=1 Tax=Streptococcus agalactiae TaxID=1311 RepID=UPI000B767457|nr:helix-turn-helix transcriptional regulator [Streptococcus agalactiae]OTG52722.1 transcriptional regulator [Streptococcus agalactiae]QHO92599.1 transcriptional regulator [Streptococcus agalactiae]